MIVFIVKRLLWLVLVLWTVFTVSFFLMYAGPGDPFERERALEPEIRRNLERAYGLDKPLHEQYLITLKNVARFNLGYSIKMPDVSVNQLVAQGFPISASLGVLALSFAICLGLTAGIVAAVRRGTALEYSLMAIATIGIAVPNFVVASLMIILFVFLVPIFPAAGWGTVGQLILPAFCLGAPYAAYIARLSRTGMLEVLNQDYIRTAYAKGLTTWQVVTRHALKAAILPVVSFLGPAAAGILTGSLVVERIFAIPGMGVHFVEAALQKDYTVAMGVVLVYTVLLYLLNLVVDVCYSLLDPRVQLS